MKDPIERQAAIDIVDFECGEWRGLAGTIVKAIEQLPPAQPDTRLSKIVELMEGTIDHFDLDDAMDLLYQIKDALRGFLQ